MCFLFKAFGGVSEKGGAMLKFSVCTHCSNSLGLKGFFKNILKSVCLTVIEENSEFTISCDSITFL